MAVTRRDPYEVLGVAKDVDADELKAAYRRKAMQYHPDRNPGDKEAEERFKELSEAYATLRDPEARARYDRYGAADPAAYQPDTSNVNWQDIFREADINIDWGARGGAMPSTGNAVFDALFGAMAGMLRGAGMLPGQTYQVKLPLTLGELTRGAVKSVRVPGVSVCQRCRGNGIVSDEGEVRAPGPFEAAAQQPRVGGMKVCPRCGGRKVNRGELLEVKVPAGASPSAKLRLAGAGGPGQPPGDVMVQLALLLPEGAKVVGNDVHVPLVITPWEARRGAAVEVEGVEVIVPAGARSGSEIRVMGGGVRGGGRTGDLVVTVEEDWLRGGGRLVSSWFRKLGGGGEAS